MSPLNSDSLLRELDEGEMKELLQVEIAFLSGHILSPEDIPCAECKETFADATHLKILLDVKYDSIDMIEMRKTFYHRECGPDVIGSGISEQYGGERRAIIAQGELMEPPDDPVNLEWFDQRLPGTLTMETIEPLIEPDDAYPVTLLLDIENVVDAPGY